ncbi:MAG: endolytic transglycosylase MltG [Roseiflexus sp.]|nr:endolytic transglycosylase MltG [Roseiflexus sp.]MCS7290975.1 endolytic transglycosylase MltG [Roseiflexus sp.]MDW8232815.1 endolytic transglycosylase MltG [Roseiflexaceae bacterium]
MPDTDRSAAFAKTLRAIFLGIALLALSVACVGYLLLIEIRRPAGNDASPVEFIVEPGDSASVIATRLGAAGLIRQPLLFTILVRFQGLDSKLQAGRYLLRADMTMSEIIAALQNSRVEEVQVTIIEGSRLEEIAEQLAAAGLVNVTEQAFLRAARNGAAFQAQHFYLNSLPPGASLEGYLFPDTYRFAVTATVTEVIEIMLDRFDEQYATLERDVTVPRVTVHDIVTMASIVQREAAREDEMPKIAAVFWNRLKPENLAATGGKLGADPTVQYILGQRGNWWPRLDSLSVDEINGIASPYNTRVNPGLPPGPIASPGLAALRAAARPDDSAPYLYFVASCTNPGAHNFAVTFEEFQRFEQEYLTCPSR